MRKILLTAENLEERYNEALPELGEMVNAGTTYFKVEVEEGTFESIEYWTSAEDFVDFNEQFEVEEEELLEPAPTTDNPFGEPTNPDKVTVTLKTITSRLKTETVEITRVDCNNYTTKGALAVYETGQAIRSYNELCAYVRNTSTPVIMYTANKTGN